MRWGLVGIVLVTLIAAGCGGGGALALDPVASAATQTLGKETGRFQLTATLALPRLGRTTLTAEGMFNAPEHAAQMTVNLPDFGTPAPSSVGIRVLYPVIYVRIDSAGESRWLKVDLQRALKFFGLDLPQLDLGGCQAPADVLAWLRGSKNATKLGTETIAGVKTTHYRVEISVADAIARATPRERQALRQFLRRAKQQGSDLATKFDVWVSDDGLVRRLSESLGGAGSVTMTFSDYGVPVQIEAPRPDETVDFSTLLSG